MSPVYAIGMNWIFYTLGYHLVPRVLTVLALGIESYFIWLLCPFHIPQSMRLLLFFFLNVFFTEVSFFKKLMYLTF